MKKLKECKNALVWGPLAEFWLLPGFSMDPDPWGSACSLTFEKVGRMSTYSWQRSILKAGFQVGSPQFPELFAKRCERQIFNLIVELPLAFCYHPKSVFCYQLYVQFQNCYLYSHCTVQKKIIQKGKFVEWLYNDLCLPSIQPQMKGFLNHSSTKRGWGGRNLFIRWSLSCTISPVGLIS